MKEISDEELMCMFQNGDTIAFDMLFERYKIPIFNFIYRMLNREKGSAEDLLQEIFIKIVKGKDLYEPRAKFSTWLFAITRNHCLNFLKSKRYSEAKNTISLDGQYKNSKFSLSDKLAIREDNFRNIEDKEMLEILEEAVSILPDKYREVFILHAIEGFTHKEISEVLKINPATVRTDYRRAKLMLKEKLSPVLKDKRSK